jgi:methyl coenzyme M reductase subunit C
MQEHTFHRFSDLLLYCRLCAGIAAGVALASSGVLAWIIAPAVIIVSLWSGLRVRGASVCEQCGHTKVFRHFGQG